MKQSEAFDFIKRMNVCLNLPNTEAVTYWENPPLMCEYDELTGEKIEMGYGVKIIDSVMDCMTEQEIGDILILPNNINVCDSFTGTTN